MKQRVVNCAVRIMLLLGVLAAGSAAPARAISSGVAGISATDGDVVDCLTPTGSGGITNQCDHDIPVFINMWVSTSGAKTYQLAAKGSQSPVGSVTCRAVAVDRYGTWIHPQGAAQTASLYSVYTNLTSTASVPSFGTFMAYCTMGPGTIIQSANW